jgi:hypothetical protein
MKQKQQKQQGSLSPLHPCSHQEERCQPAAAGRYLLLLLLLL